MAVKCIDRVIAILNPIHYRKGMKPHTCFVVILSTWVCSGLLVIPYFYVGYIRYLKIFSFVTVAIAFISLLSALVIYKIYLKPVARISANGTSSRVGTPSRNNNADNRYSTTQISRQGTAEKRVNLSFLIMLLVFLVTYLPAAIMVIYMNTCHDCDCVVIHLMRDFTYLLILSSATWRPLNFILRLRTIRREVKNVFTLKTCVKVKDLHVSEVSSQVVHSNT